MRISRWIALLIVTTGLASLGVAPDSAAGFDAQGPGSKPSANAALLTRHVGPSPFAVPSSDRKRNAAVAGDTGGDGLPSTLLAATPSRTPRTTAQPTTTTPATPTPTPIRASEVEAATLEEAMEIMKVATNEQAAEVFDQLSEAKGVAMMAEMEPKKAGAILEDMTLEKAVAMVEGQENDKASRMFEEMSTPKVVKMMGVMEIGKVSDVWSMMAPVKAGDVFEEVPSETGTDIVKLVSEERLIPRLPEVTAPKLWEIPLEVLTENLPSVPVMHLDFWIRPQVAPDLAPPTGEAVGDRTVYSLPEARGGEWAALVASPAPIHNLWARFRRPLNNIRLVVDELDQKPAGSPPLPPGRLADAFLNIGVEGAQPADISVAAAIVSVRKSWIDANAIHKWSVEFSRLDQDMQAWVPSPSKRVREDQERVFFAVVVPGFSTIAITGSSDLPQQMFEVTTPVVRPTFPAAGEEITISAEVINTGGELAVYPAQLWLNHSIEQVHSITLAPGETAPIAFTVSLDAGEYEARVERNVVEFTVSSARLPATGGAAPSRGLVLALAALGLGLVVSGGYFLARRRPPS